MKALKSLANKLNGEVTQQHIQLNEYSRPLLYHVYDKVSHDKNEIIVVFTYNTGAEAVPQHLRYNQGLL
jgi:capsid protein